MVGAVRMVLRSEVASCELTNCSACSPARLICSRLFHLEEARVVAKKGMLSSLAFVAVAISLMAKQCSQRRPRSGSSSKPRIA